MKHCIAKLTFALLIGSLFLQTADAVHPRGDRVAKRLAATMPWHGPHAYPSYGQPLALVVPPTASTQVRMGWGVTGTEKVHIYHQFGRPYPGDYMGGGSEVYGTPNWPSHTDQFGVYYVRGPW